MTGTHEGEWVMKNKCFNDSVCEVTIEHSAVWVGRESSCRQFDVIEAVIECQAGMCQLISPKFLFQVLHEVTHLPWGASWHVPWKSFLELQEKVSHEPGVHQNALGYMYQTTNGEQIKQKSIYFMFAYNKKSWGGWLQNSRGGLTLSKPQLSPVFQFYQPPNIGILS